MNDACNRVDSAQMYHNERETGRAINDFLQSEANVHSLKRQDIHFTSKLASNSAYETARKAIKRSVKEAGLGYIDLFLLHSPYGGKQARLDSWRAVEDAIDDGEVRIGGVSNYGVKHVSSLTLDPGGHDGLCFTPRSGSPATLVALARTPGLKRQLVQWLFNY